MAYNIFERWPFTSFQNLNLDWLLNAMRENRRIADNSYQIAEDTAAEVETFSGRINTANDNADSALHTAEEAQTAAEAAAQAAAAADDLLFLFATADNHAVDYNEWAEGGTDYVTAADIFSALTLDHKLPVFMDREENVYSLSGYESSGLSVSRWRFTRYGGNGREYIAWIDTAGTITFTHIDSGGGEGAGAFMVTITRSQSSGNTTSDKTYSEVAAAFTAEQAVICHVVDEIGHMDFYTAKCEIATAGANSIYRWESPQQYDPPRFHIAFLREDGLAGIYVSDVLPSITASDNGKFLRVVAGAWEAAQYAPTTPRVEMTSADSTPTMEPNKLYVFPEMASLTPSLATPSDNTIVNEYHFIFTSGATATVLTLPASVLQPDGFTVEANMHYEISVLEGAMTAQGWAVTA